MNYLKPKNEEREVYIKSKAELEAFKRYVRDSVFELVCPYCGNDKSWIDYGLNTRYDEHRRSYRAFEFECGGCKRKFIIDEYIVLDSFY